MIDPDTKHANENLTRLEKMRVVCEMPLFFSYCFFFLSWLCWVVTKLCPGLV